MNISLNVILYCLSPDFICFFFYMVISVYVMVYNPHVMETENWPFLKQFTPYRGICAAFRKKKKNLVRTVSVTWVNRTVLNYYFIIESNDWII